MPKNRGFSLMELAISIGLITILVGAVSAGGGMMTRCRVQREVQAVDNLRLAAQNYLTGANLTFSGVSVDALKTAGLLPNGFDPSGSNSFGGDYTVSPNADDNTKLEIILANIPEAAAADISAAFQAKADSTSYDDATKEWKAVF
jgi:prepilin-type N-terminal cleavage/methylation domain-containing protein